MARTSGLTGAGSQTSTMPCIYCRVKSQDDEFARTHRRDWNHRQPRRVLCQLQTTLEGFENPKYHRNRFFTNRVNRGRVSKRIETILIHVFNGSSSGTSGVPLIMVNLHSSSFRSIHHQRRQVLTPIIIHSSAEYPGDASSR